MFSISGWNTCTACITCNYSDLIKIFKRSRYLLQFSVNFQRIEIAMGKSYSIESKSQKAKEDSGASNGSNVDLGIIKHKDVLNNVI